MRHAVRAPIFIFLYRSITVKVGEQFECFSMVECDFYDLPRSEVAKNPIQLEVWVRLISVTDDENTVK